MSAFSSQAPPSRAYNPARITGGESGELVLEPLKTVLVIEGFGVFDEQRPRRRDLIPALGPINRVHGRDFSGSRRLKKA